MAASGERVEDLIALARGGRNGEACDELCRRYRGQLLAFARSKMGHGVRRWTDAEDVVQRALLETVRALDDLPQGAGEAELLGRMRLVCLRRIQDVVRARRNDAPASVAPEWGREPAAGGDSGDGSVTRSDTRRWLVGLIEHLPEGYDDVVRLCALQGLSYRQAGQRLGLGPEAVRKRYERARDLLARRLEAHRDG